MQLPASHLSVQVVETCSWYNDIQSYSARLKHCYYIVDLLCGSASANCGLHFAIWSVVGQIWQQQEHIEFALNCDKCLITPHVVNRKLVLSATTETGLFLNLRQHVPISPTVSCQETEPWLYSVFDTIVPRCKYLFSLTFPKTISPVGSLEVVITPSINYISKWT